MLGTLAVKLVAPGSARVGRSGEASSGGVCGDGGRAFGGVLTTSSHIVAVRAYGGGMGGRAGSATARSRVLMMFELTGDYQSCFRSSSAADRRGVRASALGVDVSLQLARGGSASRAREGLQALS